MTSGEWACQAGTVVRGCVVRNAAALTLVLFACGGNTSSDPRGAGGTANTPAAGGGAAGGGNGGRAGAQVGGGGVVAGAPVTGGAGGALGACAAANGGVEVCARGEYCDFDADDCGQNGALGRCTPLPLGCDEVYRPLCGCDGKVHANACAAARSGADAALDACTTPSGYFPCGTVFCSFDTFCRRITSDIEAFADSFTCVPMPDGCSTNPGCACLSGEDCDACTVGVHGGLSVTCLGG